ncbi:F-box protein [Arabidopsis thaliana]
MMMSDLPHDLVEEILSRLPLISLKAMRSTCKTWNVLSKHRSFANKHIGNVTASGERDLIMIKDCKVYSIGVNLHGIQNNNNIIDLSIKNKGIIHLENLDLIFKEIFNVFHCNGLLLLYGSITDDSIRLVVCNPYWGKREWVKRINNFASFDKLAFGYDKSCGCHKILRVFDSYPNRLEIYNLSSNSRMVSSFPLKWDIAFMQDGVSLKGNTYWYAKDRRSEDCYLICFDFTRERFGPRLPLPQPFIDEFLGSLYVVREEKLAVLVKRWRGGKSEIDIWVTNKIEPDEVSWSKFLKVDNTPRFFLTEGYLIYDEEKVVVFFNKEETEGLKSTVHIAYIVGENGYFRRADLREPLYQPLCRLVCSYVPSSVK